MFEQTARVPWVLARHCQRPLAGERHRYLVHCAELKLSQHTRRKIAAYLLVITDYLRLGERPSDLIGSAEIKIQAERWAKRRDRRKASRSCRYSRKCFIGYATSWLKFLGRWQPPPVKTRPCDDRVKTFADYMSQERGLSPNTVSFRCRVTQRFLDRLCSSRRLEDIAAGHVDDAILDMIRRGKLTRVSIHLYALALRAFFRYAETRHWCRPGLADAIRGPRVYSHSNVPSGPSWDDVQRLLATTEGNKPGAIRDRAILMLLAVYGCRADEVVRLRLEDLDWRREQVHFTRHKLSTEQTFPLARLVGDAILRYLHEVRPLSSYREIFLTLNAPFRPLGPRSVWWVVGHRMRSLGLSLPHFGPHALRHACATHLLEQGFTLKQIGDHLGHREPETTRLYAKVDLRGLRQVADFSLGDLL